jgi:hypothetical protein
VTIDGPEVRAGITLPAFETLIARAGPDLDRDIGRVMVSDIIGLLRPAIEAHLQSKHFHQGVDDGALIIDTPDLVTL